MPDPDERLRRRSPHRAEPARGTTPDRKARTAAFAVGGALLSFGAATVALQVAPRLQVIHPYTVMTAALIPYGAPAFLGAAALLAASGRRHARPVAAAALAGLLLQAWWAKPYWPAEAARPLDGPGALTVLTMNMRCESRGVRELGALADGVRPDVAVVQGLSEVKKASLGDEWHQRLPYSVFLPMPHLPTCGTFVFSRTPLRTLPAPGDRQPVIEVTRQDAPLLLLPVDLPSPNKGVDPWLSAFHDLTVTASALDSAHVVAAGDFNAVREHMPMRDFLHDTGLRDAAEVAGSGWTPTFPSGAWHPPLVALDHILVGPDLGASDVRTVRITGQQHLALVARVGPAPR